jgi:hypothetical protein
MFYAVIQVGYNQFIHKTNSMMYGTAAFIAFYCYALAVLTSKIKTFEPTQYQFRFFGANEESMGNSKYILLGLIIGIVCFVIFVVIKSIYEFK